MKFKLIFAISFTFLCFMLLSTSAFAMPESDIEIKVTSPVNSLVSESGVVTVEQFPAEVTVNTTAKVGTLTEIQIAFNGNIQDIGPNHTFFIGNKEACGVYTITAKTDNGAVLTISANVVFQVKATCDVRYRTLAINLKEVYDDQDRRIKVFPSPQRIELANANTIAGHERERIAELVGRRDGKTYTLKGSLVVEVYNHATGNVIGTYDVDRDFDSLTTSFHWTPKTLIAFEIMRNAAISYQAPVKINVGATWCSENKQEVYGKLTAQDKGVPEYLYPYKTASVTFSKDDIPLSRNFIYKGLEWDYTPETAAYTDGESQTQTSITQRINCRIPAADFYFKFKKQDADDLSVTINAPATVYRGDSYSFDVTFTNNGTQPAYDVPLKGKVDDALIKEIPDTQDFAPNESKTYTIKRKAGTSANVIHLWANIGVPDGFIDGNMSNNTARADIQVIDKPAPKPAKTPEPIDNPDNSDGPTPPDEKPDPKKLCDLSVSILAPPTVYEHENYSFTVIFTNQSDTEVTNAALQGSNNDTALIQIPKVCSFKPKETKSYVVAGKAGNKGEVYNLLASIEAPEGFKDENPNNNTAVSKITVIGKTPDKPTKPEEPPKEPDKPPREPDKPPANPDKPPVNPDKPPVDPDKPKEKLCDLWVNLSTPPCVYEHDEYSFTVYFTNDTDKALSDVELDTLIDNVAATAMPSKASFEPHETKAFTVKAKAGEKDATIRLRSDISPPPEYVDTNLSNNTVSAEIAMVERPYDLDVQRITPDKYKENQTVVSTIKVSNKGSLDFTPGQKVTVLFEIPELSVSKRVNAVVMESGTYNIVSVKWDTPNVQADKNITLIATINPDHTLANEESAANNTYTRKAVIQNVFYEQPTESTTIPAPPQRFDRPRVTWVEQRYENDRFIWRSFYAELKVSADIDYETKAKGYIKSGYGFSIKVTATVDTNYDRPELITIPQTAEVYLPQYRYQTAIPLLMESPNHFAFRENPSSPYRYKKQYVPVWFPDNKEYIIQLLVTDVHTPGGTLSKWTTGGNLKMKVVDSMYSDDITTGSGL